MSVGCEGLTSPLPRCCQLPWHPPRRHLHLDIYSPYISWHCMSNGPDATRHKYLWRHTDRCGVIMYRHDFSKTTPLANWIWLYNVNILPSYIQVNFYLTSVTIGKSRVARFFNSLRPRQNGRHFADDTFKRFFRNENVWITVSLKAVPNGPINNIPALVQIMAWRRPGDKPLSESMMVRLPTHICVTRLQWEPWIVTRSTTLR